MHEISNIWPRRPDQIQQMNQVVLLTGSHLNPSNGPFFHFNLHLLLLELFRRHFPACFNF
ncbi:hypothetical protein FQN60_013147 [Etheostoma spectabile]|uniref:Uncharacterized protein n=1 Tax=Etheostoma spectabile TaxID=54343 RepID=A0A5J5D507_9PERO|nr:hypothetical protein FQN60_013147 [Etheostoma spectabile]